MPQTVILIDIGLQMQAYERTELSLQEPFEGMVESVSFSRYFFLFSSNRFAFLFFKIHIPFLYTIKIMLMFITFIKLIGLICF